MCFGLRIRKAIRLPVENAVGKPVRFFAIGDKAPSEQVGTAKIEFLPCPDSLVECYQATDVYLHAARAETCGIVITEAMACGTPAVETALGGILEQIVDGKTGFPFSAGDPDSSAGRLFRVFKEPHLVHRMGESAAIHVEKRLS
jgi:glycosyltransferase involved in cell wall biosynthesis